MYNTLRIRCISFDNEDWKCTHIISAAPSNNVVQKNARLLRVRTCHRPPQRKRCHNFLVAIKAVASPAMGTVMARVLINSVLQSLQCYSLPAWHP